jgi:rhomboid protease GluP
MTAEGVTTEARGFEAALARAAPRPVVTPLMAAACVIVFVLTGLDGAGWVTPDPGVHVRWGSNLGLLTRSGEWWRILTAAFLHFGIVHLALNVWVLIDLGRLAERLYGRLPFLAIYLFAAVTGGLASLAWQPDVNSAGASGAIFGVLGALIAFFAQPGTGVPGKVLRRHLFTALAFLGYSLAVGFTQPGIDNAAHLGGLAGGFALGWLLVRPIGAAGPAPLPLRRAAVAAVLAVAVIGMAGFALPRPDARELAQARFGEALDAFALEAAALLAEREAAGKALNAGGPREELVRALRGQAARWNALSARMASPPLPEKAPLRPLQRRLAEYTALQRDAAQLIASAVATNSQGQADQAAELMARARALESELTRELDALRAKPKPAEKR